MSSTVEYRHRRFGFWSFTVVVFTLVGAWNPSAVRAQALSIAEARASNEYSDAVDASRELIHRVMEEAGIPGASVAVGIGDKIVWAEGFGWADLELRVPVNTLTKFRVGSVSKTMTASGLGVLLERGQIDVDASVHRYVSDFPEKRWPITIRQIAGHTAGIRHYLGNEFLSSTRYPTVDSGLEIFSGDTLLFEPGTAFSYSTYGFNLLSAAMEEASGTDFLTFMRDEVFEPLGLRHTVPGHADSIITDRASFYEQNEAGAVVNAPYVDNSYKWAGGGFLSTPEDLVRFGRAHLKPGFLQASTLALLQTSQTTQGGEETGYGLGWFDGEDADGDQVFFHSGGSVGGTTLLLLVPAHDLVVAGVVNITGPASMIVRQVAQIFEEYLEAPR